MLIGVPGALEWGLLVLVSLAEAIQPFLHLSGVNGASRIAPACNCSTQEAEVGGHWVVQPAWAVKLDLVPERVTKPKGNTEQKDLSII